MSPFLHKTITFKNEIQGSYHRLQRTACSGSASHLQTHLELLCLSFHTSVSLPSNTLTSFPSRLCLRSSPCRNHPHCLLLATCAHLKCHLLRWLLWAPFFITFRVFFTMEVTLCICLFPCLVRTVVPCEEEPLNHYCLHSTQATAWRRADTDSVYTEYINECLLPDCPILYKMAWCFIIMLFLY